MKMSLKALSIQTVTSLQTIEKPKPGQVADPIFRAGKAEFPAPGFKIPAYVIDGLRRSRTSLYFAT
jgi:hypothetical protein